MPRRLFLLAFVSGATVMAAEVAASRLVAPSFGSSTPVWGALIAFVLAGTALGAFLGGRWADATPNLARLCAALAVAAAALAALPFVGRWSLGPASAALLSGHWPQALPRLAALAALGFAPLLVLGATGPFLLRVALAGDADAGRRAGALSAANTVGSVAGALLSATVVLPALGTARTMAGFALLLAVAAASGLRWRFAAPALLTPVVALALAPLALQLHPRAIDAIESTHGLVQALEYPGGRRELLIDQAWATQSTWTPGQPVTGEVFGHYVVTPAMRDDVSRPPRVLFLGLGAGTGARGVLEAWPGATVVGVELDAAVVDVARRDFALPDAVEVHIGDARTFLATNQAAFDVVVVDAFRFPYVPFHLATQEFFSLVRGALAPGGVACFNVGRYGPEKAVVDAIGGTVAGVFPEVLAADARNHSNTLLFAGDAGLAQRLEAHRALLPGVHRVLAFRLLGELARVAPGPALTDDSAPVEALTDAILVKALVSTGGRL